MVKTGVFAMAPGAVTSGIAGTRDARAYNRDLQARSSATGIPADVLRRQDEAAVGELNEMISPSAETPEETPPAGRAVDMIAAEREQAARQMREQGINVQENVPPAQGTAQQQARPRIDPADVGTESGRDLETADPSELLVLPDGSARLGSIDADIAAQAGIPEGEIQANVGAIRHADRGHGTQIRNAGYDGARSLGYGWADRFHNDWDDNFREMTDMWHQNRDGHEDGRRIDYIHSLGFRYEFGPDGNAFVDVGIGEGKDFRKNAQIAASYPIIFDDGGTLALTGYFIWGKYEEKLASNITSDPAGEYHFSASVQYRRGPWTLFAGYGQTHAPDSREMQFRLTPWGNSDNRNFIQTWGQLDDFVWDGEKVIKVAAFLDLSEYLLPGLRAGVSFLYGWDIDSYDGRGSVEAREIDLSLEYVPVDGSWKGWSLGVYPAWLRFDDGFYGKHSRNDIKVILGYNVALDFATFFK